MSNSFRQWPSRLFHSYLLANNRFPVATAIGTSAVLWVAGDSMAQTIEARGENRPLDMRRLFATTVEGSLVNGGVGCLWYKLLDNITTHRSLHLRALDTSDVVPIVKPTDARSTLHLTAHDHDHRPLSDARADGCGGRLALAPGSVGLVLVKLGLECLLWHPASLATFWIIVGTAEGHSPPRIRDELRRSPSPPAPRRSARARPPRRPPAHPSQARTAPRAQKSGSSAEP